MRLCGCATFPTVALVLSTGLVISPTPAWSQPASAAAEEDPAIPEPAPRRTREGIEAGGFDEYETAEQKQKRLAAEYGIGLRVRTIYVPRFVFELFVDQAPSGLVKPGAGIEVSRRKGNFEMVLGVEYESLSLQDGFWLGKDSDPNVPEESPDYLEFEDFSWVAADLAFLFSVPMHERLAFRYGAGLGVGVLLGEVRQTDSLCEPDTDDIEEDCEANPDGEQVDEPADLPPVLPVVDLSAGLQWRPAEKMTVNLDAGLRSAVFIGLSSNYYF
jgi:hypothetical protein